VNYIRQANEKQKSSYVMCSEKKTKTLLFFNMLTKTKDIAIIQMGKFWGYRF